MRPALAAALLLALAACGEDEPHACASMAWICASERPKW